MLQNATHLTFQEVSDMWARENADHPAGLSRDKILERIVDGLRNDEFDRAELTIRRAAKYVLDDSGNDVRRPAGWQPVTQDMFNYLLFRDVHDANYKQILEELRISKRGLGKWCDNQGRERPKFWFYDTKTEKQSTSTIKAERDCENWLIGLMDEDKPPQKAKAEYRADAKNDYGVSTKAFDRTWANAIMKTGNTKWSTPGPRSIRTPN